MPLTKVKSGGVSDSITLTSPDINAPDIDGGTIDNAVIGGSTAAAGSFTTITATGGSSSNWNTAYGWGDHSTQSYATQTYVGTAVSNLVDSSPAALDTLNELAAALGDDPNFATTVTNSIALKAPLASPSFTGTATMDGVLSNGGGINDIPLEITHSWGASGTPLIKASNASSEVFRVQRNGLVGIGTSSPDQLLQLGSETYGANAIIKTQVDGSDAGDFDAGLHMRSHNDDFGGSIVLESRSSTNDIINFKYHNNSSAGVSAMAIDATNGNVGIGTGTAAPASVLHIDSATTSTTLTIESDVSPSLFTSGIDLIRSGVAKGSRIEALRNPSAGGVGLNFLTTANNAEEINGTLTSRMSLNEAGSLIVTPLAGGHAVFNEAGVDADFRVESDSNSHAFFVDAAANSVRFMKDSGSTTVSGMMFNHNDFLSITTTATDAGDRLLLLNRQGGNGDAVEFRTVNIKRGSIVASDTGVTYNTTSDRRLKKDIETITDGTDKLMAMNPVTHGWKADPEADAVHGFIAQEMIDIVPEAVSGDPESDDMMSMDYGRITPVLVAALQDAHKKIAGLETRLNELEGK
jgi:hypothetical protein